MGKNGANGHLTKCGIPGIDKIPFGMHLCDFYPSRQHLVDSLVPYFAAGLRNNESCIWITAAPFPADAAKAALAEVLPGLEIMIDEGQLRIIEAKDWYAGTKGMDKKDVIELWLQEEERALAEGHRGLRITGNTSFLSPEDWDSFMGYESALSTAVKDHRIVVLCTYDVHQCQATNALETIRSHLYTLERRDINWEVLGPFGSP